MVRGEPANQYPGTLVIPEPPWRFAKTIECKRKSVVIVVVIELFAMVSKMLVDIFRPTATPKQSSTEELPVEYLTSSLAQQNQVVILF